MLTLLCSARDPALLAVVDQGVQDAQLDVDPILLDPALVVAVATIIAGLTGDLVLLCRVVVQLEVQVQLTEVPHTDPTKTGQQPKNK